ncbi:WD40 repeat-like protein [Mycena sanguinolenta]|uniref:WD40 repeat-like protein n=1 Tax=Mycena sanguinolenta TaxID=230812 RepID=A0A8H7DGC5_9AGAR|nr:WD40 repeat-like protein [Mycena sanguinolenta]
MFQSSTSHQKNAIKIRISSERNRLAIPLHGGGRVIFFIRVEANHETMNTAIAIENSDGVSWEDELHIFTLVATHRVRKETIVGWVEEKADASIRSGVVKRQLNATGTPTQISYRVDLLSSDSPCASERRRKAKLGSEVYNVGAGIQAAMKMALCPFDPASASAVVSVAPEPVAGIDLGNLEDLSEPLSALLKHVSIFTNLISKLSEVRKLATLARSFYLMTSPRFTPYAKFACSILTMAQTVANAQKARDGQLRELMKVTTDVFVFANKLKLPVLEHHHQTVKLLTLQTTECAYFIRDYTKQQSFIMRAGSTLLTGGAINDKIAEYQKKFKDLQAAFHHDSSLNTEIAVLRIAERLEQIALAAELDDLPYASARFDIQEQCLDGTREAVLEPIFAWINDSDVNTPRVLLLSGNPGIGKSAIAHTVSQRFNQLRRLGSSFFFLTEQPERSPDKLFTTVARDLADLDQGWKDALEEVVGSRALRRTASIREQFEQFILRPIQRLPPRFGPVVIVIDALDAVADPVARHMLVSILSSRAAEFPSHFRVLITARPDSDIREAFRNRDGIKWLAMETLIDKKSDLKAIEELFDNELSDVPGLKWKDKLCHKLVEKSDGDFGWAAFACKFIKGTSGRITSPSDRVRRLLSKTKAIDNIAHLEADDSESESEGFFHDPMHKLHNIWYQHHQDFPMNVNAVPSFPVPRAGTPERWAEPLMGPNSNYSSQFVDAPQANWNFVADFAHVLHT